MSNISAVSDVMRTSAVDSTLHKEKRRWSIYSRISVPSRE